MAQVTVRNDSNFEPDVGLPTLLKIGETAKVDRTPEIDDYIEAGVLADVAAEKAAEKKSTATKDGDA